MQSSIESGSNNMESKDIDARPEVRTKLG